MNIFIPYPEKDIQRQVTVIVSKHWKRTMSAQWKE